MKEKRYTLPEEQEPTFASEPDPTVAYRGNAAVTFSDVAMDEIDEGFDWDRMPYMGGPFNEEEAIARIEAIESENERTGISYTVDEFFKKLHAERAWQK